MVSVLILAGGKGKRMESSLPKVLHCLGGRTLIESVVAAVAPLQPDEIGIVGSAELFAHPLWATLCSKWSEQQLDITPILQTSAEGTGDAARVGVNALRKTPDSILICYGDTPLLRTGTLKKLCENPAQLTLATMQISDPEHSAYGRVLLQGPMPVAIKEACELSDAEKSMACANAGVYHVRYDCLSACLKNLKRHSLAKEFYLTDMVALAHEQNYTTGREEISKDEAFGINTPQDLMTAPVQNVLRHKFITQGVVFQDPKSVILSMDTEIEPGCAIGAFVVFGPKVKIAREATILPFSYLENCAIGSNATVGPFAHIKMDSVIGPGAVVGNFVEIKKSTLGAGTKAKHLSYIGDATLGESVNVGAGTVFCNYDGQKKHPTYIDNNASIGANTSLVAPLHIGESAFIGAGSVITQDVSANALALSRSAQNECKDWVLNRKSKK